MKIIDKSILIAQNMSIYSSERFMHFCFIYDKNKLLSIGRNFSQEENAKAYYFGTRFNIENFKKYKRLHSEIDCISKLWSKVKITGKEKMIVIRIGKTGHLENSKPCKNCSIILSALGFKSVFHSTPEGVIESEI